MVRQNQYKALTIFTTGAVLFLVLALTVSGPSNAAEDSTAQIYYEKGVAAKRLGQVRTAERNYLLALRKDARHLASYLAIADLYYVQRRYNDGLKMLEQGIEQLQDVQLWAHKGMILNSMGKSREAQEAYEQALSYEPENENILERVSGYYHQTGNTLMAETISGQLKELRAKKAGIQANEVNAPEYNQSNQNNTGENRVTGQGVQP